MQRDTGAGLSPLGIRIHRELVAVRKTSEGWTVATAGLYPTICAVLSGGDPHVAFAALRIAVISLIDSPGMVAAAASLGLTTDLPTHTDRLNDAGADLHLGERQVRRLSDAGLVALARFLATNWNQAAIPALSLSLIRTSSMSADLAVGAIHLRAVEMSGLAVDIGERTVAPRVQTETTREHVRQHFVEHLDLDDAFVEITVRWRGELWPRFNVSLIGRWGRSSVSTLGNRLSLAAWTSE